MSSAIHSHDNTFSLSSNINDIYDFLNQNRGNFSIIKSFVLSCVQYGDLNRIIYLHQNGYTPIPSPLAEVGFIAAANYGKLDFIRYFHHNGVALNSTVGKKSLYAAIREDQWEIIQYFHQQGFQFLDDFTAHLSTLCGMYGSLNCLEYLHKKGLIPDEINVKNSILAAAENNRTNIMDYLFKNGLDINEDFSREIFNKAATKNNEQILLYYLENKQFMFKHTQERKFERNLFEATLQLFYIKEECIIFDENSFHIFSDLYYLKPDDIKTIFLLASANGHFNLSYFLKNQVALSLSLDHKTCIKAFELALINNRSNIISFFLSNKESFLQERNIVKEFCRLASLFCDLSTIEILITYFASSIININLWLLYFSAMNNRLDIIQYLNGKKGVSLQAFLQFRTENIPEGAVRKFLSDREVLNELKGDLKQIHQMKDELMKGDKVFHPSHFWEFFNEINISLLKASGFKNFKRNINQNYFNFIPSLLGDTFFYSIILSNLFNCIKFLSNYEITDPDIINKEGEVKEPYRCIFPRNRKLSLFLYKFTIGGLWNYVTRHDPENLLQQLEEPRVGNPIEIKYNKKLISQDLANSVQEYYFIKPYITDNPESSTKIVEIGAGYGRLGYVFLNALKCKYIIFDIPPALYIAQKYLSEVFPDKRVFTFRPINSFEEIQEELEKSDIAFFTINQINLFPKSYANLCINISSLHEMRVDQVSKITECMSKIAKDAIYIKQYKKYKNPYDKIIMKERNYQFPDPWFCTQRRTTPTNIRFFEKIYQRKE